MSRLILLALAAALLLGLPAIAADRAVMHTPIVPAMTGNVEKFAMRCDVPVELSRLQYPMPVVSRRLAEGKQLTIVALGASSTEGVGASSPANAYPERLEAELHALFPNIAITVFNKGIGGEDSAQMLARFERDVLAIEPDLLIWQAGVNAAIKGWPLDQFVENMSMGIDIARKHGIDVMMMGPQNAPRYLHAPHRRQFADHMMLLSRVKDVPIFPRFRIMTHWMQSGAFKPDELIGRDGLHMTDTSYYCLSRVLAQSIAAYAPIAIAPGLEAAKPEAAKTETVRSSGLAVQR
ncbi:MAG: GDSL-type esterase/lipase family protein [Magnetospirillum sp.]|nr:GDSL-type esterase/lipase family protein [Magnetospirillum sp.]